MMGLCFPIRFLILSICTIAACVTYLDRSNINVTVIAMTDPSMKKSREKSAEICLFPNVTKAENEQHCDRSPKFKWDQSKQGQILGAFFYSYILFQVPMGAIAGRFGGKWIVAGTLLLSGIINLATPFIASIYWLMVTSRVVLGAIQSGVYPAIFAIICHWLPVKDRSLAFALLESGGHLGSIVTTSLSGWLSEQECGWPMVFYVSGTVALIYSFIFSLIVTSEPKDHKLISKEELDMILNDGGRKGSKEEKARIPTPWIGILTSKAVFAIFASKFAASWLFFTLGSKLPAYLSDFIHVDLTKNGLLNSSMYFVAIIAAVAVGYTSERIVERNWTSRTNVRKTFHVIAAVGMAIPMALIPAAGCSEPGLMTLVLFSWFFMEFNAGGDKPLPGEVTKNHPAIVYAIVNSTSMSTGFIAPAVIGWILDTWGIEGWRITFYLSSVVSITGMVFFLSWASAERQPFDFVGEQGLDARIMQIHNIEGDFKTKEWPDDNCIDFQCTKL